MWDTMRTGLSERDSSEIREHLPAGFQPDAAHFSLAVSRRQLLLLFLHSLLFTPSVFQVSP